MVQIKKCIQCNLPEEYPGIKLDENERCNLCSFYENHLKARLEDTRGLEDMFAAQIEKAKARAKEDGARYDCIVGFSGGKDSTYVIHQLKKRYGMRVLAVTADNGFGTEYGKANIQRTLPSFDIEHISMSMPDSALREYYRICTSLFGNFCMACFHIVHYFPYLLADRFKIPLVVNGRTRGQVYKTASATDGIEPFVISENLKDFEYQMFGRLVDKLEKAKMFDYLPQSKATALSYFVYHDVSEEEIVDCLEKELDWRRAKVNHEDCWAHDLAENMAICKSKGYPIMTGELAYMVRVGKLSKEDMDARVAADTEKFSAVDPDLQKRFQDRIQKLSEK